MLNVLGYDVIRYLLVISCSFFIGWFRAILPKSALRVEEEAWNAYPYTRTRYTCPFIGNFLLDIETRYYGDSGSQDNVFNLNEAQLRERIVGKVYM